MAYDIQHRERIMSQTIQDTKHKSPTRNTDARTAVTHSDKDICSLPASFGLKISAQIQTPTSRSIPSAAELDIANTFRAPTWLGRDALDRYRADMSASTSTNNMAELIMADIWRPVLTHDINGIDSYSNFVGLSAFVFDVEYNTPEDQIISSLDGVKAVIHSTYRHSLDNKSWRVIIPINGTITMDDHLAFYRYFQVKLKGRLGDFSRFDAFHWFRLPACPEDAKDNYSMITLDGMVYDRRWWLETINDVLRSRNGKAYPVYKPTATVPVKTGDTSVVEPTPTPPPRVTPASATAQEVIEKALMSSKVDARHSDKPMPTTVPSLETTALTISSDLFPLPLAPTPITKPTLGLYSFPFDYDFSDLSNKQLVDSIKTLVRRISPTEDYFDIRDEYCTLSIELNIRGLWAPAFRPELKIPKIAKDRNYLHLTLHRDRIFIDCHWLHSKEYTIFTEPEWEPLFDSSLSFNFELCEKFATRDIKSDYRTESILRLTKRLQFQLKALRGGSVITHENEIDQHQRRDGKLIPSQLKSVTSTIDRWCERQPRVNAHRSKYIAHAQARLLLALALSPSWHEIAELGGLIQGAEPLGDKTVSDFMKKLDLKVREFETPVKL